MTPAQHLAEAERLLDIAQIQQGPLELVDTLQVALVAQGHALVALAAELGVPHLAVAAEGGDHA